MDEFFGKVRDRVSGMKLPSPSFPKMNMNIRQPEYKGRDVLYEKNEKCDPLFHDVAEIDYLFYDNKAKDTESSLEKKAEEFEEMAEAYDRRLDLLKKKNNTELVINENTSVRSSQNSEWTPGTFYLGGGKNSGVRGKSSVFSLYEKFKKTLKSRQNGHELESSDSGKRKKTGKSKRTKTLKQEGVQKSKRPLRSNKNARTPKKGKGKNGSRKA